MAEFTHEKLSSARELVARIAAMLTRMIQNAGDDV
jgi:hypothetical protein